MASVTGHEVTPPSITAVDCHLHSSHAEAEVLDNTARSERSCAFEDGQVHVAFFSFQGAHAINKQTSGPRACFVRKADHLVSCHYPTESCACSIRFKALVNVPSSPCMAALRDGGLRSSGRGSPEPDKMVRAAFPLGRCCTVPHRGS